MIPLPLIYNARREKNPRVISNESNLLSTYKSDVFLLQMKQEKLSKRLSKPNLPMKRIMVGNESEIQHIIRQSTDVEAILSENQYENAQDAVQQLYLKVELMQLVERQMKQLETMVLQCVNDPLKPLNTRGSSQTLSRIPGFLAVIDRMIDFHDQMQNPRPASNNQAGDVKQPTLASSAKTMSPRKNVIKAGDLEKVEKELLALKKMRAIEKGKLTQDVTKYKKQCQQLADKVVVSEEKKKKAEDKVTAVRKEYEGLLKQNRSAVATAENNLSNMKALYDESHHNLKQLNEEKQLLESQVREMEQKTKAWESDSVLKGHQNETQTRLNQELNAQNKTLEEKLNSLVKTKDQSDQETAEIEQLVDKIVSAPQDWSSEHLQALLESGTSASRGSIVEKIRRIVLLLQKAYEKLETYPARIEVYERKQKEFSTIVENYEIRLRAAQQDLENMKAVMDHNDRLAKERLEPIEATRMELEEKLVLREQEFEAQSREIQQLTTESDFKKKTIDKLQQDKRELLKQHVTDETFADTYEAVMKVEFETMKMALSRRVNAAEEQVETIEKDYARKIRDLLKSHKDERVVHELKLRRATSEIHVLKENLKKK